MGTRGHDIAAPARTTADHALAAAAQAGLTRRRWMAVIVVCLGYLMVILDTTAVNVALPALQRQLHFSQSNLTWVIDAYLLSYGSLLLVAGRLGDLFGRRRMFLGGVAVFTLASIVCATAESQLLLIVARFVQGAGGAAASSAALATVLVQFSEPHERAKAMGAYIFIATGGGGLGLLLGGALATADWRYIFLINVPIGIVTLALTQRWLESDHADRERTRLDVAGAVLITAAMLLAVYAIIEASTYGWGAPRTSGSAIAACVLLVVFAVVQARRANAIVPPRILRVPALVQTSAVRALLAVSMSASLFFGVLYLQHVRHLSPLQTGLAFLPFTAASVTMSLRLTPALLRRFGPRPLVSVGMLAAIAGLALFASVNLHTSYFPTVFVAIVLIGLGASIAFLPLTTTATSGVAPADAGVAAGIVNVSLQLSTALGLAALSSIAATRSNGLLAHGDLVAVALTRGYALALAIAAALTAFALALAFLALRPRRDTIATKP